MTEQNRHENIYTENIYTVVIKPCGSVHIMMIPGELDRVLERYLGEAYLLNKCRLLPLGDTIMAFSSMDDNRALNEWGSKLCKSELHGDVILMPVENKQFVLWDYGKAEILQAAASGWIKMRKRTEKQNREERARRLAKAMEGKTKHGENQA